MSLESAVARIPGEPVERPIHRALGPAVGISEELLAFLLR
jgi:hypothetical protein